MNQPLQQPIENARPLNLLRCGDVGRILSLGDPDQPFHHPEMERSLLEIGFVEGAHVEMLHAGFPGRDPLAVRINHNMTVALRRNEACAVWISALPSDQNA